MTSDNGFDTLSTPYIIPRKRCCGEDETIPRQGHKAGRVSVKSPVNKKGKVKLETKPFLFFSKKRHIFAVISVIAFAIIYGGHSYYSYEAKSVRKAKELELQAVASLKADQIIQWHKERIGYAKNISQSPFFIEELKKWLNNKNDQSLRAYLSERLILARMHFGYEDVLLVSPEGEFLFAADDKERHIDTVSMSKVIEASSGREITFTDFYFCSVHKKIHYEVIAPVVDKNDVPIAALILRVDPYDYLYPLIQSWPTSSKSSETLIVRKDGDHVLFLNELRHQKNTAMKLRLPIARKELPAVQAVLGYTGIFEGRDYRGKNVLAEIMPIEGTSWFMIVKTDEDEIYSELHFKAKFFYVLTFLIILSFGFGFFWIHYYRQKKIYMELFEKEKVISQYNEQFKITLYSIGDAVITTDANGRIKQMNHVAESLTGWKEEEAGGIQIEEVFRVINEETRCKIENPVERVLRDKVVVGLANHSLLISKNEKEIPIADSGAPILGHDREIVGVVLVFRDQSPVREAEKLIKARLTLFEYSASHTLDELLQKTLDEVGVLTGSPVGFYHFVESDQLTLSLKAWTTRTIREFCKAEQKDLHYGIDKAGVWADCIKEKKPVIHNDYASLPHKKGFPAGHAPVIRELVIPVLRDDKIVAVLGMGNKPTDYTEKDVEAVSYLADVAWELIEHKKAQELLAESEALNRNLVEHLPHRIFVKDRNSVYLFCNSNFGHDLGISAEQIKGKDDYAFFSSELAGKYRADDEEVMSSGKNKITVEEHEISGEKRWVETIKVPHLDAKGKVIGVIGIFEDITERMFAEEELRESKANYENFFMEDPTGNLSSTPEGNILACNPAFIRIFGFSSVEEALQTNITTLYRNPNDRRVLLSKLQQDKIVENWGVDMVRKDGKLIHVVMNLVGRFDNDGNLSKIQVYLFDDTKRRQLEDQLIQSQKLESLGTLASGIAHDFNNILGIMMGQTYMLGCDLNDHGKLKQQIETIDNAIGRGATLVQQLLAFARKTEPVLKTVKINDIINEIMQLLSEIFPKTIVISAELQNDLPSITADASQIHQVLLNLFINARDAMPMGGSLSIFTKTVSGDALSQCHKDAGGRKFVCIEVIDTGTGMNETVRQKIFDPFFTTKDIGKGTGLGLALAYGIVAKHRGFIDVESESGKGTKFSIYFPVGDNELEILEPVRKIGEDMPGGTETILVIEDEGMLRQLMEIALVSKGYRVLMAEDGEKGVETYLSHQKEIDLVITDLGLPKLGGEEVFMSIMALDPDARIIIASGYIDVNVKSELSKAGAKYYLQKPYRLEEVFSCVRAAIDRK